MSSVPVYPQHWSSSHPLTNNLSTDTPLSIQGGRTLSFFMFAYMPGVEGTDYSSLINGSPVMSKEVMIDDTTDGAGGPIPRSFSSAGRLGVPLRKG